MDAVTAVLGLASVKKIIDAYRFLFDGDTVQWRSFALTVGSWVLGTGLVALVAASSLGESMGLVDLNLSDLILLGVGVGSGAGVVADTVRPEVQLIQ